MTKPVIKTGASIIELLTKWLLAEINKPFTEISRPFTKTNRLFAEINRPFSRLRRPFIFTRRLLNWFKWLPNWFRWLLTKIKSLPILLRRLDILLRRLDILLRRLDFLLKRLLILLNGLLVEKTYSFMSSMHRKPHKSQKHVIARGTDAVFGPNKRANRSIYNKDTGWLTRAGKPRARSRALLPRFRPLLPTIS